MVFFRVLFLLAAFALSHVPVQAQFIYWSNFNGDTIGRARIDGTGPNQDYVPNIGFPLGLAVNPTHIYWAESSSGAIGRANLDGSGANPLFIDLTGALFGVVLNATHIFWANGTNGTIGRAELGGGDVNPAFISGIEPGYLAVNATHIFWSDANTTIGRANLDGSGGDAAFIPAAGKPTGVAVNDTHIFWANISGLDTISRANLDGNGIIPAFITGASGPGGVAVDATHIFWANQVTNTIGRADLNAPLTRASAVDQNFITGANGVSGLALGTGVLPVELAAFDALVDGTDVVLTWTTATETDNAGFEVQVSGSAAGGPWIALAFIDGHGTTLNPQSYTYRIPDLGPGRHRFRLKQVDFDGAFEFSPVVEADVAVPGTHALSAAYPNPFNGQTVLALVLAREQAVILEVFDVLGRRVQVHAQGLLAAHVQHRLTVASAGLVPGLYHVRVRGEGFTATQPIQVMR